MFGAHFAPATAALFDAAAASGLRIVSGLVVSDRRRHLGAGVRVTLGTDVGGGTGFGMLKEALLAHLMQRVAAVLERVDNLEQALAAIFTLAGAESVREVRVEGSPVYRSSVS